MILNSSDILQHLRQKGCSEGPGMISDRELQGAFEKKWRLHIVQWLLFPFSIMLVTLHSMAWIYRLQKYL